MAFSISIVVPAFNERGSVRLTVERCATDSELRAAGYRKRREFKQRDPLVRHRVSVWVAAPAAVEALPASDVGVEGAQEQPAVD